MPSDKEIIKGIISHDHTVLNYVYKELLPYVDAYVVHHGGNSENARDIFQEGMIIIYRKIESGKFTLQCKFSTYLYAVCKRLWIQERKKYLQRLEKLKEINVVAESSAVYETEPDAMQELFQKHFNKLSPECQQMLRMYFNGVPLEEIRKLLGMKTVHHASDKKYRCKKNLIERIKSDPFFKKMKK